MHKSFEDLDTSEEEFMDSDEEWAHHCACSKPPVEKKKKNTTNSECLNFFSISYLCSERVSKWDYTNKLLIDAHSHLHCDDSFSQMLEKGYISVKHLCLCSSSLGVESFLFFFIM